MKFFYCDSCFMITARQEQLLGILSQYKDQFFISEIQIKDELIKPDGIADLIRKYVTVIKETEEIINYARELMTCNHGLSFYDCLCLAFCIKDEYCLITDDKALIKKCSYYKVMVKTTEEIKKEFSMEGSDM